jgi:hypothetical protein
MVREIRDFSMTLTPLARNTALRTALQSINNTEMNARRGDAEDLKGRYSVFATAFVAGCAALWLSQVSNTVPSPYLVSLLPVQDNLG